MRRPVIRLPAMSLAQDARRWLRAHRYGLLSTHSRAVEGYPFGSVVPYVLDHEACPVLLVSRLAEHTRNLAADAGRRKGSRRKGSGSRRKGSGLAK